MAPYRREMERELKEIRDEVASLQRDEHTRLEREKKAVLERIKEEVCHVTLWFFHTVLKRCQSGLCSKLPDVRSVGNTELNTSLRKSKRQ